jgi:hypothetical protein
MRVKMKWVGSKEKFFDDILKVIEEDGKWLIIDNVEDVRVLGR